MKYDGATLPWRLWTKGREARGDDQMPSLDDLNYLHEIEETLWGNQQKRFRRHLIDICQTPEDAISASAGQRREAILKSLNLWTP